MAFEYPDSLEEASKAIGQQVKHTDFISQLDAPEILRSPAVAQAIVSPEVKLDGLNSEVIEVAPEHIIVVRVDDARDETVLPIAEVQEQVAAQLSRVKGEQQALETASEVVAALQAGNGDILTEKGLAFGELEKIDRRSPLAQTVFAMAKPEQGVSVYAQSKDLSGNVVVVALEQVEEKLEPMLAQQISVQLQRVSAQRDLSAIVATLRANTDIEYYVVSN